MPLLDRRSSPTARAHLKLLPLSAHAPLKSRGGPTEQSSLLSQFLGAATRAKRVCHDGTWGPLFPHTNLLSSQSLAPSRSSGKSCFCPFPTFIQEEPQQRQLRQNVFGKAKQEAAARIRRLSHGAVSGTEGSGSDGRGFAAIKDKIQCFSSALGAMLLPSAPQSPLSRASEGAKRARHQSDLRAASSSCLPKTNPETPAPPLCPSIHLRPILPSALTSFRE